MRVLRRTAAAALAWALAGSAAACSGIDPDVAASCSEAPSVAILTPDLDPRAPFGSERALLWVPGCLDLDRAQLVMLLHGSTQSPDLWFDEPVAIGTHAARLDRTDADTIVLASGGADGGQFFVDYTVGPLLDAVAAELGERPPVAAIGGFSAGGNTAARLAFGPDRIDVRRVGLWAPSWASQFNKWIEDDLDQTSIDFIHLDAGDRDRLGVFFVDITGAAAASDSGVTVQTDRRPGGHTIEYIADRMGDWLELLALGPASQ